jgi:hypothetical protein
VSGDIDWTDYLRPMNDRSEMTNSALPSDSAQRKAVPLATGVLDYFAAALAEVAKVSKAGNDKHNPGQPLHHARGKSTDHADSLLRHLVDRGGVDPDTGQRHTAEVAWRALALLQQELEDAGAPLARGARPPDHQPILVGDRVRVVALEDWRLKAGPVGPGDEGSVVHVEDGAEWPIKVHIDGVEPRWAFEPTQLVVI